MVTDFIIIDKREGVKILLWPKWKKDFTPQKLIDIINYDRRLDAEIISGRIFKDSTLYVVS